MLFNSLLLKIETGQELTEQQEKRLARSLMLIPSLLRMTIYVIIAVAVILLLYVGFIGGYPPIGASLAFILAGALLLLMGMLMIVPKVIRIKKYLDTVNKYYEIRFKDYKDLDLYYIDQHVSPYIKPLSTKKIYVLTDGYHFLFMSDPFKNTKYKMPKLFNANKEDSYLRVINKEVSEHSQIMVRLEDVENFYITSNNIPEEKPIKQVRLAKYIKYFFNQTSNYVESCIVVLKLKSGVILRLSHEIYPVLKNLMIHKERKDEF